MNIVFTSYSKNNFYLRHQISAFVLKNNSAPINPFMNWDYNLSGLVDKKLIRIANNSMITKCHELWVFGKISDGVLVEIFLAKKFKKKIRYFALNDNDNNFQELTPDEVILEDVSPWMWEWVLTGKNLARWHPRLRLNKTYPLIFPAYSKRNFYWYMQISQFCLEKRVIPLNPFMLFKYFLGDLIPRPNIYKANSAIIKQCDELWTFGDISDGVMDEIKLAKKLGKKIRHFKIVDSGSHPVSFRKIQESGLTLESEIC